MRTYISPIGFNPRSVVRPVVLSRGVAPDDEMILLRPAKETDTDRAEETIAELEQLLRELETGITPVVERIPHDDFPLAVLRCSELICSADGTVILNLSGGARDILSPLTVAATAHAGRIDTMLAFSDIDSKVREWDLPRVATSVPESTYPTLQRIADQTSVGETGAHCSLPALAEGASKAKTTITRHVNQLADAGLVDTWTEGKTKYVRISLSGQLFIRNLDGPDNDLAG